MESRDVATVSPADSGVPLLAGRSDPAARMSRTSPATNWKLPAVTGAASAEAMKRAAASPAKSRIVIRL
jgi:hypothetical protein